jgi:hypothetical protein
MAINVYCKQCTDFSITVHSPQMVPGLKEVHTADTGHLNYGEVEIV